MEINLVTEGFKFMVLGMVTVFLFLVLMVIVLNFQSKLLNKFFPPKAVAPTPSSAPKSAVKTDESALVAAITAAIQEFRNPKS